MSFDPLALSPPPPSLPTFASVKVAICPKIRGLIQQVLKNSAHFYKSSRGIILSATPIENGCCLSVRQTHQLILRLLDLEKPCLDALPLCSQVAAAPKSIEELGENLKCVLSNYPRYQMGNHLEVYDLAVGSFPIGTKLFLVRKKLREQRLLIRKSDLQPVLKANLTASLNELIEKLKPVQVVKMGLLFERHDKENGYLLELAIRFIERDMPFIMTKCLRKVHAEAFDKVLQHCDTYILFDLILVMPKGLNPNNLGFNVKRENPFNHCLIIELNHMLLKDTQECAFKRFVTLGGHGLSHASIAGVSVETFLDLMELLEDRKISFLSVNTCYGGGVNSIHFNPEGTCSFPVLVRSATEQVSYGCSSLKIPAFLEKLFFISDSNALSYKAFSKSNFERILSRFYKGEGLACLETLFLPSAVAEISKIPLTPVWNEKILDLREAQKRIAPSQRLEFQDENEGRDYYLFSDPVSHLKIATSSAQIGLAARGGPSRHLIQRVTASKTDLVSFTIKSLSTKIKSDKCFLIGQFTCLYEGRAQTLRHVAIIKREGERLILFKKEEVQEFNVIIFSADSYQIFSIDLNTVCSILYSALEELKPFQEQNDQYSLEQQEQEYFYEAMDTHFWDGEPPLEAKFYYWYYKEKSPERMLQLKKLLSECAQLSQELLQTIAKNMQEPDLKAFIDATLRYSKRQ